MQTSLFILLGSLLLVSLIFNFRLLSQLRYVRNVHKDPPTDDHSTVERPDTSRSDQDQKQKTSVDDDDLIRFVRLHADICDEIDFLRDSDQESKSLREILALLTQALEDCGVEQFSPAIGESYRFAFGVAPRPKLILTSNRNDSWKIASVLSPGFRRASGRTSRCLQESRVSVYKYQPEKTRS